MRIARQILRPLFFRRKGSRPVPGKTSRKSSPKSFNRWMRPEASILLTGSGSADRFPKNRDFERAGRLLAQKSQIKGISPIVKVFSPELDYQYGITI
ncbi:hypothetical protein CDAR_243441 [Caerostris darwini]|uniref:DUF218 domain-containing protein n=1 Tax=Caerostris darwini TaxID=1538125 RepID=A0AAV4RVR8_9ARAC|nr:hypothetical protein CDAR_243441 [Caerostris darwini]